MLRVLLAIQCKCCREIFEIKVTRQQWKEYIEENKHIPDIFPEISLIPCICGKCWDNIANK